MRQAVIYMARVVDTKPHLPDLNKFLDGQIWELTVGVDFAIPVQKLRCLLSIASRARGLKLQTRILGNKFWILAEKNQSPKKS